MLNLGGGQNQQGGLGGGLVGLISAIPQYIAALKVQKVQQDAQKMAAANQELDVYRQQAKTPGFQPTPEWIQAVSKVAASGGIQLPFQAGAGGTVQPSPAGASTGGPAAASASAGTAPAQQTQQPRGPQLDLNAFTGQNAFAEAVAADEAAVMEAPPGPKRDAIISARVARPLTADESKQLAALPQQLPPAQQVAEQKAIDTLVTGQLKQAAAQGTASALIAVVRFNYGRFENANYTDDQINALLDPALEQLSPAELSKIAAGNATSGLKTAQAAYIQQSAQAKIDKINADVKLDQDRGSELAAQAQSIKTLLPAKAGQLRALASKAYADAAADAGKSAQANAEARYYTERATDLKTNGDPRAQIAALTSIRAAKSSTDAQISNIRNNIAKIQTSLTALSPQAKVQNDAIVRGLNDQLKALQDRSNQYDQAITTLTNKMAPAAGLGSPSLATGTATPPVVPPGAHTNPNDPTRYWLNGIFYDTATGQQSANQSP